MVNCWLAIRIAPKPPYSTMSYATTYAGQRHRGSVSWLGTGIDYQALNGQEAAQHLNELTDLYTEVYSEPPYAWGPEHAALFRERFDVQRRQEGFTLVTAGEHGHLVGFGFGVTLQPTTPWWRNLLTPLPDDLTAERPGRTWALSSCWYARRGGAGM